MSKKQITYLIIFIAIFLIAIVGATYAYFEFGGITIEGNLSFNTATGSSTTFTAYSEGNIELDVNKTVMSKDVSSRLPAATDNSTIHIKLEGGTDTSSTTCTYDLIWVWDSVEQYKTSTVDLPYTHTDGTIYPYEFSVKLGTKETNLSDFTWNENKAIIATKSISASSGETKTDDYDVVVNFYNLPIRQNNLSGKLYQGHIEVSEARCNANPTLAVVAKEGDNLSSSIRKLYTEQGTNVGNGKLYLHDSTLENGANDNSYRYSGADPDNYVCFAGNDCSDENNLYRIIGIFDNQLKIIKYTSALKMAWNKESNDKWENSDIDIYLNNVYFDSMGNKAKLIADTTWSVAGINVLEAAAKQILDEETNMSVTINRKIGLMYLSDYMYAASNQYWSLPATDFNYPINDYRLSSGEDWLQNTLSSRWTISRGLVYGKGIVIGISMSSIDKTIGIIPISSGNENVDVHPAFYLKENIIYVGGMGTQTNPIMIDYTPTGTDVNEPTIAENAALIIKSLYKTQGTDVGNGKLYLHDSTLENGAGDNSYRYAGTDPDNYVCFEEDECNKDNMYRIIGVFDNKLKLIKLRSIGNIAWDLKEDGSSTNNWEGSSLDQYLNNEYLNSLGTKQSLIANAVWSIGGTRIMDSYQGYYNVKATYDIELDNSLTITRKIGLMYLSDYGYASENNFWTSIFNYNGSDYDIDWLLPIICSWTISKSLDYTNKALGVMVSAHVFQSADVNSTYEVNPTFYLNSSVLIKRGNGSSTNPYIISK